MKPESFQRADPTRSSEAKSPAEPRAARKVYLKPAFTKFDLVTFTHGALAVISPDGSCYFS